MKIYLTFLILMFLTSCSSKIERKWHPRAFAYPVFSSQTEVENDLTEKLGAPLKKVIDKNEQYVVYNIDGDIIKFIFIDGEYSHCLVQRQ